MNPKDFNHYFIKVEKLPSFIVREYAHFDDNKICTKCNLIVCTDYYIKKNNKIFDDSFFFINYKEILKEYTSLSNVNLTCEELQIKLLLE